MDCVVLKALRLGSLAGLGKGKGQIPQEAIKIMQAPEGLPQFSRSHSASAGAPGSFAISKLRLYIQALPANLHS